MMINNKPICIIEVNENLRRVELGMELTRPLKQLNNNCHFKEKYEEWCDIRDEINKEPEMIICDVCKKEFETSKRNKKYCSDECRKKMMKVYSRKYYNKPETKLKYKMYYNRPEVRIRTALYSKKNYEKWKKSKKQNLLKK